MQCYCCHLHSREVVAMPTRIPCAQRSPEGGEDGKARVQRRRFQLAKSSAGGSWKKSLCAIRVRSAASCALRRQGTKYAGRSVHCTAERGRSNRACRRASSHEINPEENKRHHSGIASSIGPRGPALRHGRHRAALPTPPQRNRRQRPTWESLVTTVLASAFLVPK